MAIINSLILSVRGLSYTLDSDIFYEVHIWYTAGDLWDENNWVKIENQVSYTWYAYFYSLYYNWLIGEFSSIMGGGGVFMWVIIWEDRALSHEWGYPATYSDAKAACEHVWGPRWQSNAL